ncbi:hypothetical protein ACQBAT_02215 [Ornithinimicrobium sp. Y1847]|uniref:hypothetical protein n=1 Tax=Ornithinimicrobium sp. Y1847 TaxID=3405419 RepID=UPI003B6733C5
MERTPALRLVALAAGLTLALSACTSEDPASSTGENGTANGADGQGTAGPDGATETGDGLQGEPGRNGWLCDYVSPSGTNLAAGGEAVSPRSLVVQDDDEGWVCEVLSGGAGEQEPIIRLSVLPGEEAREEMRAEAEALDYERGPTYLGHSYISAGRVTGLTQCRVPGEDDFVPYTLLGESLLSDDAETTDVLRSSLALAAQGLDRGLGCNPRQVVSDMADDAESTTAP